MSNTRPNLLFLITDQQRADTLHALGNGAIRTPALDRLAAEGTAFTNAFTPAPECVPARCCLTYGQYPAQTGCHANGQNYPEDGRETYMQALTRAGYRTHGIGKYHFEFRDHAQNFRGNGFQSREIQEEIVSGPEVDDYLQTLHAAGFDHVSDPHGVRGDMYYMPQPAQMPARLHPTQWVGDRATHFLREVSTSGTPWMNYVSFIHPHPPFCPPAPWHKLYRDLDVPPPHVPDSSESNWIHVNRFQNRYKRFDQGKDGHRIRMLRAYYYGCISFVDYQIGRILDTLEQTGQADNTLVVFTSDHGELLGDFGCVGKRSYHNAASKVPLLLRWPGRVPAAERIECPVNLIDLTSTLLTAAGTAPNTHACEGLDLVELAQHPLPDRTVFTHLFEGANAIYTAVNREWKFVYSAPDQRELLFNLRRDPGESMDLAGAGRAEEQQALREMRRELQNHLRRTGAEGVAMESGNWRIYARPAPPQGLQRGFLYQDHPWAESGIPGYTD